MLLWLDWRYLGRKSAGSFRDDGLMWNIHNIVSGMHNMLFLTTNIVVNLQVKLYFAKTSEFGILKSNYNSHIQLEDHITCQLICFSFCSSICNMMYRHCSIAVSLYFMIHFSVYMNFKYKWINYNLFLVMLWALKVDWIKSMERNMPL